jgi:hypothetical protein
MGADPEPLARAVRDAARTFLARSAASERVVEVLAHLDVGRTLGIVDDLVAETDRLRRSIAEATSGTTTLPSAFGELVAHCGAFVARHGPPGRPARAVGHIGWAEVIPDDPALYAAYGFVPDRSIESFAALVRYLGETGSGVVGILAALLSLTHAPPVTDAAAGTADGDALDRAIRDDIDRWTSAGHTLDRVAHTVGEVLTETTDFTQQRAALAAGATAESDSTAARLLNGIARVQSQRAWIVANPAARLTFVDPAGGFRLRLGFASGAFRAVVLGADYWETTGLEIDPESFADVRIDGTRNTLVWSNGHRDSGDRLHLAIVEGRLAATSIDPIEAFDIVPGRSVGPFRLGMTRDEVDALDAGPRRRLRDGGEYFPLAGATGDRLARGLDSVEPGAVISYDASDRCSAILAIFSWSVEPPVFTLLGRVVNGMTLGSCAALLRAIAADVTFCYGAVSSASAGISASTWEASDEHIMSVRVRPAETPGGR